MTNKEFTKDDYFRACCVRANSIEPTRIDPTARQASKFRRKMGSAYKNRVRKEMEK